MINIEQINNLIHHPIIKVISFDIFDTLIERPVLYPTDIFILLDRKVRSLLKRDDFSFHNIRTSLEDHARRYYFKHHLLDGDLTFPQLYDYFQNNYGVSVNQRDEIASWELKLEKELLSARQIGMTLFLKALETGKRIISISDMYHSSDFLKSVLAKNGFTDIDRIYVSSEIKKRKDSGELFEFVIKNEGIRPYELLHIGDNLRSDHLIPSRMGIVSYHLPSSRQLFSTSQSEYKTLWNQYNDYSPCERLVIGFFVNRWCERLLHSTEFFPEKEDLGYFGIGPVLFSTAQYLKGNSSIQEEYDIINFASRDGYLPMKAYDLLCKDSPQYIKSRYIYCGRSLYNICHYDNMPSQYIMNRIKKYTAENTLTIGHLFDSLCHPRLLSEGDARRNVLVRDEARRRFPNIKAIIAEKHNQIHSILISKYNNVKQYYSSSMEFSEKGRAVIFDCGYNGSVSDSIMRVLNHKIDKIYIWESSKNKYRDKQNNTNTFLLAHDIAKAENQKIMLAFEELCSSIEGSCIDIEFKDNCYQPLFDESTCPSETTKDDLRKIQNAGMQFVDDMNTAFGEFLEAMEIENISFSLTPMAACLSSRTDRGVRHLERIVFPDVFHGDSRPLSEKIDLSDREYFLRTDFVNRALLLTAPGVENDIENCRIAIHIHLYHIELADCFIKRLKNIDLEFDLLISVCFEKDVRIAETVFNKATLNRLGNLTIRVVPNRGRDLAPWIIGFGDKQDDYDLMCHLHAKKSEQFSFGDQWREYLLDNLITRESIRDIVNHFKRDAKLGVVFPPMFEPLLEFFVQHKIAPLGDEREGHIFNSLAKRMGIEETIGRHTIFFSGGTMFWYRPIALRPLFDLHLKYSEFPTEPIEEGGTLAHALERMPSMIARSQGYKTLCYVKQDMLLERYMNSVINTCSQHIQRNRYDNIGRFAQTYMLKQLKILLLRLFPVNSFHYKIVRRIVNRLCPKLLQTINQA